MRMHQMLVRSLAVNTSLNTVMAVGPHYDLSLRLHTRTEQIWAVCLAESFHIGHSLMKVGCVPHLVQSKQCNKWVQLAMCQRVMFCDTFNIGFPFLCEAHMHPVRQPKIERLCLILSQKCQGSKLKVWTFALSTVGLCCQHSRWPNDLTSCLKEPQHAVLVAVETQYDACLEWSNQTGHLSMQRLPVATWCLIIAYNACSLFFFFLFVIRSYIYTSSE